MISENLSTQVQHLRKSQHGQEAESCFFWPITNYVQSCDLRKYCSCELTWVDK